MAKGERPSNMIYLISKLLALATTKPLMIYDKNGNHYILEEADEF